MAQQINEITKTPSNSAVIKILNQIIKRYNSLGDLYQYKGSVQTYDDLLAIQNPQIGDVYNVIQEDAEKGIAAGSNFAWNGTEWDNLGMGMDGLVKKINGFTPDDLGSVIFKYIKSIEDEDGTLNIVVREGESETQLTIQTGKVKTVNGFVPNDLGAVIFQYIKNITDNDGTLTITVRNGEEESTLTIDTGKVKTVNGEEPDETGNISIEVPQPTIATQAEAEAGTNNTKFMTPLRVAQALTANNGGIVSANLAQNGYVKFANGFILQWGQNQTRQDRSNTFSFPLSFSTNQVQVVGIGTVPYNEWQNGIVITAVTASNFTEHCRSSAQIFRWIAVGH